jgi:hypothetical protein
MATPENLNLPCKVLLWKKQSCRELFDPAAIWRGEQLLSNSARASDGCNVEILIFPYAILVIRY